MNLVRKEQLTSALALVVVLGLLRGASAAVTRTGDTRPLDPGQMNDITSLYVGVSAAGSLGINAGSDVLSHTTYIGYADGSTGQIIVDGGGSSLVTSNMTWVGFDGDGSLSVTNGAAVSGGSNFNIGFRPDATGHVTVDGADSELRTYSSLNVGAGGNGTLSITDGAAVNAAMTLVGHQPNAVGEIHFDGGALTTTELFAVPASLTGSGTINARGVVSDVDLMFDAAHGTNPTLTLNKLPGQDITVSLTPLHYTRLGVGYAGTGTMAIADGVRVPAGDGYLGYLSGSTGLAAVQGGGSHWDISERLTIGLEGYGRLSITGGGIVSTENSRLGDRAGATGVVLIDGVGSTLTSEEELCVGCRGEGELSITGGGTARAVYCEIGSSPNSSGRITVDGVGSTLDLTEEGADDPGLVVGAGGKGSLVIKGGGLVSVAESLLIEGGPNADGSIDMATGGMLALRGQADGSINEFLDLIAGSDAIRYWNTAMPGWAPISTASEGVDYTLQYLTTGDLSGYTVLTVSTPVPEPTAGVLLGLGACFSVMVRRGRN